MKEVYKYLHYLKKGWSTSKLDKDVIIVEVTHKLDNLATDLYDAEQALTEAKYYASTFSEYDISTFDPEGRMPTPETAKEVVLKLMGTTNYFENILKGVLQHA